VLGWIAEVAGSELVSRAMTETIRLYIPLPVLSSLDQEINCKWMEKW
jgi:hypothetical protein